MLFFKNFFDQQNNIFVFLKNKQKDNNADEEGALAFSSMLMINKTLKILSLAGKLKLKFCKIYNLNFLFKQQILIQKQCNR